MASVEGSPLRSLTIALLTAATVAMLGLSMLTNATFGYRFGTTPVTSLAFAAANVIADIWKALGLIVVTALLRHRHRSMAAVLGLLWCIALAFGISSAMGVYVQDRTALIGGREAKSARLRDIYAEVANIERKAAALPESGEAAPIDAEIEAILAKPVVVGDRTRGTVGTISARCTKLDTRTAGDCHQVALLKTEAAARRERAGLELRISQLKAQAAHLRDAGAADAPDPVAELFAWLSRGLLSVRDVGFGFPVAFGLLIEMVSAFGPVGVATYASVTRSVPLMKSVASPAPLAAPLGGGTQLTKSAVVDFVTERTEPAAETTAIGIRELHDAYARWSNGRHQQPHDIEDFIREFDRLRGLPALRGKIRKFGERYFGIAIALAEGEGSG